MDAPEMIVSWENVDGRYVRCPHSTDWTEPGSTCLFGSVGVWYARNEGGGHGHYVKYDQPHRSLVVRLPAEPGQADPW